MSLINLFQLFYGEFIYKKSEYISDHYLPDFKFYISILKSQPPINHK